MDLADAGDADARLLLANGWIFERKLDGERCLAFCSGSHLRLLSRNQLQSAGVRRGHRPVPVLAES